MSERWPVTVSVAVCLYNGISYRDDRTDMIVGYDCSGYTSKADLVMVRKASGLWTLPSGGIEQWEDMKDAALRELEEEAGYGKNDLVDGELRPFGVGEWPLLIRSDTKTSLGFVFYGDLVHKASSVGVNFTVNDEIKAMRSFGERELQKFVDGTRADLYKPDFNRVVLDKWLSFHYQDIFRSTRKL